MAVGGPPRLYSVGAAVDEQGCHAHWQTLATGFGSEVVGGLCARIGGDDSPEKLRGGAATAAARHVQHVAGSVAVFGGLGDALVQVGGVGLAATGHRYVKRCAGRFFAEHGDGIPGG